MTTDIHPFELRDRMQKKCSDCGRPTVQQFVTVSHRGNFKHGGSKMVIRPVGEVCTCQVIWPEKRQD
jgi:hypothetical protein